ncbi:MAG: hypothetical protein B7Z72_07945, partial [Gemmatimonadetes bacterium 21-71-4]
MKRVSLVLAGLLVPALASAQLPDPSTRAMGMGGAYASLARGYEAVAWNPAMLAALGRPGFTIGLPHVNFEFGSNAYGFSDVRKYANTYLTSADKQALLDKITGSTLTIRSLIGAEPLGLSVGPFAVMVGTSGEVDAGIGKDAVRLALNGNAPQIGTLSTFTAAGSNGRAWAATTAAGSFALPFRLPLGRLSVGATYKYIIGNFLGTATDLGSQVGFSPLFSATEAGQALYTDYGRNCTIKPLGTGTCGGKAGNGYGVDLGATLQLGRGGVTLSAVVVNALGKMTWDASRLSYDRTLRQSTQTSSGTVQDTVLLQESLHGQASISANPQAAALRDSLLANADFARLVRVGFALRKGQLTVAAQGQLRLKEGLDQQSSRLLSAGIEYRLLGILPLRVGASSDFAGATTLSAGTGIQLLG